MKTHAITSIKTIILSLIALLLFAVVPVMAHDGHVHAQDSSVDDSTIEQSLEEQNLDEAPAPVEVEESELVGPEPYSGFVDDEGNPLTDEEYEAYREEQSKGIFEKQPWLIALAVVVLGGLVFLIVKAIKGKRG